LCNIASFIISLSSTNFTLSAYFANQHHACFASSITSKGLFLFQSGVVFVIAQIGVVGLACQVVSA
jgi:hypothetical protein